MSRIEIDTPEVLADNELRWVGRLHSSELPEPIEVSFQFTVPDSARFIPTARPFLFAFLLPAMVLGKSLKLAGPVDRLTLFHLMEWQRAFASADPRLKVIEIDCEAVDQMLPQSREGAISAFSGGVDSCYSALRAPEKYCGEEVIAGLMVHGFDIPLEQESTFENAFRRSAELLGSQGRKSYRLRTNIRAATSCCRLNWGEQTHGIFLAAALSCYESFFGEVVIPSTYSYTGIKFPWASNPATDYLFSSRETRWIHDGSALNKLDKVRALADLESVREGVRVCWEGESLDQNCGQCFKCVATQICFWLSGHPKPEAFGEGCDLSRVATVYFKKSRQNKELFRIYSEEAAKLGMQDLAKACRKAFQRQGLLYWRNRFRRKILKKKW